MAHLTKVAAPLLLIASLAPAFADEGASGLYVPGNFGFGAGVTPGPGLYLSSGAGYYDGDIKVFIDGGKIVLDVVKRPRRLRCRRTGWARVASADASPDTAGQGNDRPQGSYVRRPPGLEHAGSKSSARRFDASRHQR
jgi:hypothetical protein